MDKSNIIEGSLVITSRSRFGTVKFIEEVKERVICHVSIGNKIHKICRDQLVLADRCIHLKCEYIYTKDGIPTVDTTQLHVALETEFIVDGECKLIEFAKRSINAKLEITDAGILSLKFV